MLPMRNSSSSSPRPRGLLRRQPAISRTQCRMLVGRWVEVQKGDLLQWADALGVAAEEVPRTLRPLVRECRELLNDTAKLRGRIHRVPDRDIDLAFMAMERN